MLPLQLAPVISAPQNLCAVRFDTPFEQYAERKGQVALLLGLVDPRTYDFTDVGPMFRLRFGDGEEIDAWPEEIDPDVLAVA